MPHRFDAHTALEPAGEGVYDATLTDAWNIGPVPDGGYQAAVSCRAALDALGAREVLNVTSYFVSPSAAGPVSLHVEVIKRGRTTSLAQVRLVQGERERVRSLVLAGDLDAFRGPDLHRTEPPRLPPPDACLRATPELAVVPKLMNEVELRLSPDTAGFLRGRRGDAPEMMAWCRFADGRPPDVLALPLFADVLPPTSFNHYGVTGWVPTLELTTQVRRRPAPGWTRLRVITRHVTAGHLEEDGEVWDSDDRLVAVFRQRAMMLTR